MKLVARIGKPHGLRGEVTVHAHTDDPGARFSPGTTYRTEAAPGSRVPRELTLRSARLHNGTWLLAFDAIPDRAGAEGLRGARLHLDVAPGAPREDENGWYDEQLVGLRADDPSGHRLGVVAGIEHGPGQDRLVLDLEAGYPAYVPLVHELVPVVDPGAGYVVVDAPPGLLELNA